MLDIPSSNKPLTNKEYSNNIDELRELHIIGVHDFGTFMANFGVNSLQRRAFILSFYRFLGVLQEAEYNALESNGKPGTVNFKGTVVASMVAQGDFMDYEVQLLLSENIDSTWVLINVMHINEDDTATLVIALKTEVTFNKQDVRTMWEEGNASLIPNIKM